MGGRILVVPGPWPVPAGLLEGLAGRGHLAVVRDATPAVAGSIAASGGFELAVVRHGVGGAGGQVVAALKQAAPSLPVVLLLRDEPSRLGDDPGLALADRVVIEPVDAPVLAMVIAVLLARSAARRSSEEIAASKARAAPPLPARPAPPREPAPPPAGTPRRKRVVVVDDDRAILGYVRLVLDKRGAEVLAYESGRDLLAAKPKGPFDLVLIDRMMPGLDGNDLLVQLRTDPEFRGAKFLISSADTRPEVAASALAAGADGFVGKPVRAAQLAELFDQLRP